MSPVAGSSARAVWRSIKGNRTATFALTAESQIHSTSQTAGVSGDVRFRNCTDPDSCSGNREVLDLVTRCQEAKAGCEWEGELRSLEEHKSTCLYIPVPCPQECDAGHVLKKDLESHLRDDCSERDYNCPHCNETGRYRERVTSHLQHCPMVLTQCPNKSCEQNVPRSQVQAHVATDCEFTVLSCRYREHGCGAELPRRDMEAHESDYKLHLEIIAKSTQSKISSLEDEVEKLAKANTALQISNTALQNSVNKITTSNKVLERNLKELTAATSSLQNQAVTFKIANCTPKKRSNEACTSPSFYTRPKGYNMQIIVYLNGNGEGAGTHISVFVHLIEGDHDNTLRWPFVGEVSVTLLNQLEDDEHHTVNINITPDLKVRIGDMRGSPTYIPHTSLGHFLVPAQQYDPQLLQHGGMTTPFAGSPGCNQFKNRQYLKDGSLYFEVSVSTPDHKPWLKTTVL